MADTEGELKSSMFVCFKQTVKVRVTSAISDFPSSLLRLESDGFPHETRIMGQLLAGAYYGMRTHHIALPHSRHTHSHTQAESMLHHLTGDRNQTVPQLSEQSSVMLRIPQIPKWSGLVPQ